jgi:hypothetical protein
MALSTARYRFLGVEHAAFLKKASPNTNEVQAVTIVGTPTGGTFNMTYDGQTTAAIVYNATALNVQTALEALTNINPGDVAVTGAAGGPYTVVFGGTLGARDVVLMTANGTALTGGTNPDVVIATTTPGVGVSGIAEHDIHFINGVNFDTQTTDITYEGDNQSVRKTFLTGFVGTIVADTYDLAAISSAFNKQEVTTGLPAGVAARVYFGDSGEQAGARCGFIAQVKAENLTTGAIETLQFVCPVGSLTVVRPPALQYNTKGQLNMTFTAEKSSTDIAGTALPGVPAQGAFWFLDRMLG